MQRFSEAAVQFSGVKRDDPLASVQVGELVETASGTKLIWTGVAGAEGYCVYHNGDLVENVKFIGTDGMPYSGFKTADKTGYSVTAYKPNSGGCGSVPAPVASIHWPNTSITELVVEGNTGTGTFNSNATLVRGEDQLADPVQYRCFTQDHQAQKNNQTCEIVSNGQFRLQNIEQQTSIIVEAHNDQYSLSK
ncbi:hypothetical protein [Shewanella surugensis]|uniref:Uncharacterized protein n=1 Tax=Shewanella surugensis TaxID=212020 RepID=A0ABT0LFP5_9GAMM|nr:hypothetical protein [Shewanella surugensis]MCL1126300.1 hypothetical protein [Shewanella surugensis]